MKNVRFDSILWREYHRLMVYLDLQDSLTVERGRRPGVTFVHKMMQYDSLYWTEETVAHVPAD